MEIFFKYSSTTHFIIFQLFNLTKLQKILFNIHLDINSMFNIDSKINVYSKKESLFQLDKAFFFLGGGGRGSKGGYGWPAMDQPQKLE